MLLVINPLYSVLLGWIAGKSTDRLWFISVIPVFIFVGTAYTLFDIYNPDYIVYSELYLVLGLVTMMITTFFRWRKEDRQ